MMVMREVQQKYRSGKEGEVFSCGVHSEGLLEDRQEKQQWDSEQENSRPWELHEQRY